MKTRPILLLLPASCIMLVAASGCQDDLTADNAGGNGDNIRFGVSAADYGAGVPASRGVTDTGVRTMTLSAADGDTLYAVAEIGDFADNYAASRGTAVTAMTDYDGFAVSAYHYTGTWSDADAVSEPNFFVSQGVVRSGSAYSLSPTRYWPQNGKVRFLAYAPADDSNYTYYSWIEGASRGSYIHVSVSPAAAGHHDLLIAYTAEKDCQADRGLTQLNFKHALTGVRFRLKSDLAGYRLKKVTIGGIVSNGDFIYGLTDASESSAPDTDISSKCILWAASDGYSCTMDYAEGDTDSQLFFMLPQWVAEAPVDIVLESTDAAKEDFVISGTIKNSSWPMGKIVTYNISASDSGLEVTEPQTFDYRGMTYDAGNNEFKTYNPVSVTSYNRNGPDTWTVTYREPGKAASSACDWLSYDTEADAADPSRTIVKFKAAATATLIDIDSRLRSATTKGSPSSPYNLASSAGAAGSVENTANCYIVDAKGYYVLPLVYGNAITGGSDCKSYVYTGAEAGSLANFRNHLGQDIRAAWISDAANTGCTPRGAQLVWQDEPGLVSDVALDMSAYGGKGGLRFNIGSAIRQGNAVVAVTDGQNVMWSWHIWVTNPGLDTADRTIALTNHDGKTYTVLPMNLGWCSSDDDNDGVLDPVHYYKRRTCEVTFTSSRGLSQTITIVQESHVAFPRGNNVYYQWGRKDPFVGSNVNWGNKTWYDRSGTRTDAPSRLYPDDENTGRKTTREAIADGDLIKYPDKWHNPTGTDLNTNVPVSTNETYANLWEGAGSGSQYSKTVYDPSPAGWKVGPDDTFTGFTTTGNNTVEDGSQLALINYVPRNTLPAGDSGAETMQFYTDASRLHSIVFPQTGYRDWNSYAGIYHFGDEASAGQGQGFVWLSGMYDSRSAYNLKFVYGKFVQPDNAFYTCDGFPVRPVKE